MKRKILYGIFLVGIAINLSATDCFAQPQPTHREQAQAQFDFWMSELTREGGPCDEGSPKYNPVVCDEIETMVQRYHFYILILDALPRIRSFWQSVNPF